MDQQIEKNQFRHQNQEVGRKTDQPKLMTGMFRDRNSADNAYNVLQERGYTKSDINVIMSDETRKKHFAEGRKDPETGNKAAEGAGAGAAVGGTLGAIAGIIAALGTSLVIPGLGLVVAGPIAAGLAGAGAGGITGGIVGALVGWGIPEDRAKKYESGIRDGYTVLAVQPRSEEDAQYIEKSWKDNRGEEIHR
jgi:hypothetical protein